MPAGSLRMWTGCGEALLGLRVETQGYVHCQSGDFPNKRLSGKRLLMLLWSVGHSLVA